MSRRLKNLKKGSKDRLRLEGMNYQKTWDQWKIFQISTYDDQYK